MLIIENPIEVKATVYFNEGQPIYRIENVSVEYGLTCEHRISISRRYLPLERKQEVLNIIKDFIEEGMKQVDTNEGIPEEDSLLNYNGAPDNYTNGAVEE